MNNAYTHNEYYVQWLYSPGSHLKNKGGHAPSERYNEFTINVISPSITAWYKNSSRCTVSSPVT